MALWARPRGLFSISVILLCITTTSFASERDLFDHNDSRDIANLEYREAAFQLYQQRFFSSIQHYLYALNLPGAVSGKNDNKAFMADYLYQQKNLADISQQLIAGRLADAPLSKDETDVVLADLYLAIGLPDPAKKLLNEVKGKHTAAPKHSWLALARFYYQRGYIKEANEALANLKGIPSGDLQAQRDALAGMVQIAGGHYDNAIDKLQAETGQGKQLALDRYNLGLAYLNKGDIQGGLVTLDEVNNANHNASNYLYKSKLWSDISDQVKSQNTPSVIRAQLQTSFISFIKGLAAVNLGQAFLKQGQMDLATTQLKNIKGDIPYSNFPMLDKGWIDFLRGDTRKALENWLPLSERDPSDTAVQEGMLLTPFTYYDLRDYNKAAEFYRRAIDGYEKELALIQATRGALTDGSYIKAFLAANPGNHEYYTEWQPQKLPDSPINPYLISALTSHSFVEGLRNYRDLQITKDILTTAGTDIDASLNLLSKQIALTVGWQYENKSGNQQLNPNVLLERVKNIKADLAKAEIHHDIMAFATVNQSNLLRNLNDAKHLLEKLKDYIVDNAALNTKYKLMRGLLIWDLTEQYSTRLEEVKQQLQDLESTLDKFASNNVHMADNKSLVNNSLTRQEDAYQALHTKQTKLLVTTDTLALQQRKYLEKLLLQSLRNGENRLNGYLTQARLGIAQTTDQIADASPNKDYSAAIADYQSFLDHSGDSLNRRTVMVREAYLKMQQADMASPDDAQLSDKSYKEATTLLEQALKNYPHQNDNDIVLYNLAKAYGRSGDTTSMLDTLDLLAKNYPNSAYYEETQFRRGELLFSVGLPAQAADAYRAIVAKGPNSPLYDKALYKLGWSRFKQGQYQVAVNRFIALLERKWSASTPDKTTSGINLSRGEEEFVNDVLRGTALSLAQLKGVDSIKKYFAQHGTQPYEYLLYETLAQLYVEQQRIADAVKVYRTFVSQHPDNPLAPTFDSLALAAYNKGGFIDLMQKSKIDFIERYQPASDFWKTGANIDRKATLVKVHDYLKETIDYSHAKAQQTKKAVDYQQAEKWYRLFLKSFPNDPLAPKMHFLFAELLYEDKHYDEASQEYAKVAYEYKDASNGAEAAYAEVLAREKIAAGLNGAERQDAQHQALLALQRFTDTYPNDPRTPAALIKAAQQWYNQHEQAKAERSAQRLLDIKPPADAAFRRDAWLILAHGQFDRKLFSDAEHSYQQALSLMSKTDEKRHDIEENLAAAVYKQGDVARSEGDLQGAVQNFLRIKDLTPGASIIPTAQYDAAAALLALKDWNKATKLLEAFRANYPNNPLQKDVGPKLAVAYQKMGDWRKAAIEFDGIAGQQDAALDIRRDAVWQSAGLYVRAGRVQEAERQYKEYVKQFPKPVTDVIEAQNILAKLYAQQNDTKMRNYWLRQIIDTDKQGGSERTERTRLLAGHAALILANERYQDYIAVKLTHPLKKSLKHKKRVMEEALAAYRTASDYGFADITTASTYHAAQIYSDLGKALLNSERPKGLSPLELEQYNVLLEEQAYPFEEKAIALHEANARRTSEHVYDDWVKQSFAALSKLLPGRYAKTEKGEAYVDAIY